MNGKYFIENNLNDNGLIQLINNNDEEKILNLTDEYFSKIHRLNKDDLIMFTNKYAYLFSNKNSKYYNFYKAFHLFNRRAMKTSIKILSDLDLPCAYFLLGIIYLYSERDMNKAKEYLRKSKNKYACLYLADLYGRKLKGIKYHKKCQILKNDNRNGLIGRIYFNNGLKNKAKYYLIKAKDTLLLDFKGYNKFYYTLKYERYEEYEIKKLVKNKMNLINLILKK